MDMEWNKNKIDLFYYRKKNLKIKIIIISVVRELKNKITQEKLLNSNNDIQLNNFLLKLLKFY